MKITIPKILSFLIVFFIASLWMYGKICVFVEMKNSNREKAQLTAELEKARQSSPWLLHEGKTKNSPSVHSSHLSRPGIEEAHLRRVIDKVLVYLEVPNRWHWERLIYLTAIVESDGGRYLKQVRGPAKSPFQTEPETEKDILRWCKVKHPELLAKIKRLRFPAKLEIHEAECNLAYAVSLCYLEYFYRNVDPVNKSLKELCKLHKVYYNTYLGKGSVERSLKLVEHFRVKI